MSHSLAIGSVSGSFLKNFNHDLYLERWGPLMFLEMQLQLVLFNIHDSLSAVISNNFLKVQQLEYLATVMAGSMTVMAELVEFMSVSATALSNLVMKNS